MTCHGYELIAISLGLITAISEVLGLLKGVECNGILDFVVRMLMTRRRCADALTVELPTDSGRQNHEIRQRKSFDATLNP